MLTPDTVRPTTDNVTVSSSTDAQDSNLTSNVTQAEANTTADNGAVTSSTDAQDAALTSNVTQAHASTTTDNGAVTSSTEVQVSPLTTNVAQEDASTNTTGGATTSGTDAQVSPLTTDVKQADASPTTDGNAITPGTDADESTLTTNVTPEEANPTTTDDAVTSGTEVQMSTLTTDVTQADASPTTDAMPGTDAQVSPLTPDVTQEDVSPTTGGDAATSGTDAQVSPQTTDVTQEDASPTTDGGAATSGNDAQVNPIPTDSVQTVSNVLDQMREDSSRCNQGNWATPDNEDVRSARSSDDDVSPCLVLTAAQVAEMHANCISDATSALAYPSYPANEIYRPCPGRVEDSPACLDLVSGSQHGRPLCPWSIETHEDINMTPTTIKYVQCRTNFPVSLSGASMFNYDCRHEHYRKRVLVKEGDTCDQGFRYKCVELKIANACVAYIS
ncbi:Hypp1030 [Branchiostoma lanceolatum]|uniref:Hypp1030 protein n=1 Tax=Branchiostoma lanceolatum TaxID=7740 RepID=A0A8J9ZGX6_BRALA|nr:Hypp1030 [Branchiostoma lanceolatum]